jgi:hypothetical protein
MPSRRTGPRTSGLIPEGMASNLPYYGLESHTITRARAHTHTHTTTIIITDVLFSTSDPRKGLRLPCWGPSGGPQLAVLGASRRKVPLPYGPILGLAGWQGVNWPTTIGVNDVGPTRIAMLVSIGPSL